jgi:hypothetical protein
MSILLAVIKLVSLTAGFLCLSAIGPGALPAGAERLGLSDAASTAPAGRLHCRIFLGCAPIRA